MSSKNERILAETVRIGKVAAVDENGRARARVMFEDRGNMLSDFLPVIETGGGYIPQVNDRVLCLYEAELNRGVGRGFILGRF